MRTKRVIPVPKNPDRDLVEEPIVASLDLTESQKSEIKRLTGKDIPRLDLTKLELDMLVSPAGYDAPGAGSN